MLSEPNPTIEFEDLVKGLGDMVAHFVEEELQKGQSGATKPRWEAALAANGVLTC